MQQPESEYPFPSRHCTTLLSQGCFPISPFVTPAYPVCTPSRREEVIMVGCAQPLRVVSQAAKKGTRVPPFCTDWLCAVSKSHERSPRCNS